MADTALIKKLGIKPRHRVLLLNAPQDYAGRLLPLPDGVELAATPNGTYDLAQLFARDSAELGRHAPGAIQALAPGGILWIAYPKQRSKLPTDLTRDAGWEVIRGAGMEAVSLISIDETWSAVRFKPAAPDEDQFAAQYAGPKAALRPIYDRLAAAVQALGSDVELAPRKTYVALIRKRQFGVIQASTRTRVDLGLKLPGVAPTGRLQAAGGFGSGNVTHRVALASPAEVDDELLGWIRAAYAGSG